MTYSHCTLYLFLHNPSIYRWNRYLLAIMYVVYLFVYWVWDSTNSQKNRFRQQQRGHLVLRKTFPQVPWQTIKNPKTIKSEAGEILVDGWCKFFPSRVPLLKYSLNDGEAELTRE